MIASGIFILPISWNAFKASLVSNTLKINHNNGSDNWQVAREPYKVNKYNMIL